MCNPYEHQIRFTRANLDKLPPDAFGIYGVWYRKRCIYVGKAKDQPIARRLQQHWRAAQNPDLANWLKAKGPELRIAYQVENDKSRINELERTYIRRFQPLANRHHYDNTN